jgi:hypothetical protein
MKTFAQKVIEFNSALDFRGELPPNIVIMNPFKENPEILPVVTEFYGKFYNDTRRRHMILGINPGRFGGGVTGIPFTDTKRLTEKCGIAYSGKTTHEPSSVLVYEVIEAYGGVAEFYKDFYINSICPLGFTATSAKGKEVNYNYYDSPELTRSVYDFIVESVRKQIDFGIETDVCFCFGTGKNEKFLKKLNDEQKFFKKIVALEHPRFIMQYKARSKQGYIEKYLSEFRKVRNRG